VTQLTAEWDALADRVDAAPFLRPGWIGTWATAFGATDLQTIVVRRDGELVGVLPMDRRRGALRSPVNWHSPLFAPLAIDDEARDELLRQLFDQSCVGVELNLLESGSGALEPIAGVARAGRRMVLSRTMIRSPFIALDGDFADYERGLSRNRRRGLRRHRAKLERLGRVEFEVHDGREGLDELLGEAFELEASGWKGARGSAIASSAVTRRFYTDVARWAADRGWLRLAFLRVDGRPIACDYALEHGGSWYSLKAGYDERMCSFGPGALLLREEIAHCYDRGLDRLDLLGHVDPFKLSWTARHTERGSLRAFRRTPVGVLAWTYGATREWVRALVRDTRRSSYSIETWAVLGAVACAV
jgi:CelD/BcsL family acetyltransferase involved in cellulose biosynthesis